MTCLIVISKSEGREILKFYYFISIQTLISNSGYVVQSLKDNKYYIGQTNNVEARFIRHQNGMVKSTKNRRPLKLLFYESFKKRAEAMKHEKFLKSGAGHDYIKQKLVDTAS